MKIKCGLLILFLLCCPVFLTAINDSSSESGWKVAVIQDKDGYTNIRSRADIEGKIVAKLLNDEKFRVKPTNKSWWLVSTKDGKTGYIHKSRVQIVKDTRLGDPGPEFVLQPKQPHSETIGQNLQPPIPYVDLGGYPYAGVQYGCEWVLRNQAEIRQNYTTESPVVFRVFKGEKVQGLTGVLITKTLGVAIAQRSGVIQGWENGAEKSCPVSKGSQVFVLHDIGKGQVRIWINGKVFDAFLSDDLFPEISEAKWEWWVQVRNKAGQSGWSNETDKFCFLTRYDELEPTQPSNPDNRTPVPTPFKVSTPGKEPFKPAPTPFGGPRPPPNADTACAACGAMMMGVMMIPVIIVILNIVLLVWVARDAKSRGMDSSVIWMVLVMFTSLLGFIIYIFSRPRGNLHPCNSCGNKRLEVSAKCPHCGNP